jgi:hypothetical protein
MAHELVEATKTETLVLPVTDLDGRVLEYARLGLRVVRHDSGRALVELPCGIVLVLMERSVRPHANRKPRRADIMGSSRIGKEI